MALFKTDPTYAGFPGMVTLAGMFQLPATIAVNNLQLPPGDLSLSAPGVSAMQVAAKVLPRGLRVNVFQQAGTQNVPAAGNTSQLPPGTPLASFTGEYMLDMTGFPADIISATANLVPQTRGGPISLQADVSAIDTVNKLVFLQVYNNSTGAISAGTSGQLLNWQVVFKDTLGV